MLIRAIEVTSRFRRQYERLPQAIRRAAQEKEILFRSDPFDKRLETHKLHGKEKVAWAFSVTRRYRIMFIFLGEGNVLFLEIGTHDIYK